MCNLIWIIQVAGDKISCKNLLSETNQWREKGNRILIKHVMLLLMFKNWKLDLCFIVFRNILWPGPNTIIFSYHIEWFFLKMFTLKNKGNFSREVRSSVWITYLWEPSKHCLSIQSVGKTQFDMVKISSLATYNIGQEWQI